MAWHYGVGCFGFELLGAPSAALKASELEDLSGWALDRCLVDWYEPRGS